MIDDKTFFNGQRVLVFDIETTGLNFDFDSIIEFGGVEYENGELIKEYNMKFSDGYCAPFLTKSVHGIKDSERVNEPKFVDSAQYISEILSNKILITHNGRKFDMPFINLYLEKLNLKVVNFKLVDTLLLARKLKFKSNSLQFLSNHYGIEYGGHRGLGDAKSTYKIMLKLCKELEYKNIGEVK